MTADGTRLSPAKNDSKKLFFNKLVL